ncbi:unnamed protein product [Hymenolepis diminuta]|uniref:FHA domain-containing protein n=1 Tax=Hymenolepis diminuta TaxID=6216 RepID=A0A0R3SEB5_HYMDI|nr:unnamed protein product [Hymenolepis diminuta]
MEQMNLPKPDKDPEDYIKKVDKNPDIMLHNLMDEYNSRSCSLRDTTRITITIIIINRGADFVAIFISIKITNISVRTAFRTDTRKDSVRADLIQAPGEAIIRSNISKTHAELQVDIGSDIIVVLNEAWKTLGSDAAQLSGAMKCEAIFKGKTAATVCYVADRDINPLGFQRP